MTVSEHIYHLTHKKIREYRVNHPHLLVCARCRRDFVENDLVRRAGDSLSIYHVEPCWMEMQLE
jgi:hypothetical protein